MIKNGSNEKIQNSIDNILNEIRIKDEYILYLERENELLRKQLNEYTKNELTLKHKMLSKSNSKQSFNSPENSISSKQSDCNLIKYEIKQFLLEVKAKVPQEMFKQFIQYVKLLTNKKETNFAGKKSEVIKQVKVLFGDEYDYLYKKFESILLAD